MKYFMTASEIIKNIYNTTVVYIYYFDFLPPFFFLLGFWFDAQLISLIQEKGEGGEEIGVRDCLSPTDMKIKRPKNKIKIEKKNII